jgi:hypothetical protein
MLEEPMRGTTTNHLGTTLAIGVVAMGLLLGAAAAQAEPTIEQEGSTANAIRNLPIGGAVYDVEFKFGRLDQIYGGTVYDFDNEADACGTVNPVNLALTTLSGGSFDVGPPGGPTRRKYHVPYSIQSQGLFALACAG